MSLTLKEQGQKVDNIYIYLVEDELPASLLDGAGHLVLQVVDLVRLLHLQVLLQTLT